MIYKIDMLVYENKQPEYLAIHDGNHPDVRKYCEHVLNDSVKELLVGFNPSGLNSVKEVMQTYLILGFLKDKNLPLIELDAYECIDQKTVLSYILSVRLHYPCTLSPHLDSLIKIAESELERLHNQLDTRMFWLHVVWANIVLRIFDAKTYEDQITNTYDLVQYLNSEEAEAQSASSAGYLYGLSCVRKALESVLPEHTKYSNLELLISLVNKIRATNQSLSEIKSSKEFKLACDAVDEV